MRELRDKVAVVTGAASGIGRALANRLVAEGMAVVLADIDATPLVVAEKELASGGNRVLAVPTDVTRPSAVTELVDAAVDRYGAVHLVCLNAGVAAPGGAGAGGGPLWASRLCDWHWLLETNVMGVVHGIQAFVPLLLRQSVEAHLVITSSAAGLTTGPGSIYAVSKHAVTRLAEGLYHELLDTGVPVGVSVLCPGTVATELMKAERNRPEGFQEPLDAVALEHREQLRDHYHRRLIREGMRPEQVADSVVEAVRRNQFYVLPHPEVKAQVRRRCEDILAGRNPAPVEQGQG
ncbi:SDR family NAD(P)-dependent oxidoreductase [Streptomyces sp. OE57]|uniref:SDR family NAD(P)-dependent oxidoreductase n=1 Tax=Streptomyces lacaronensis TaxID=3379885 RepID=UPI0039B77473